MDKKSGQLKLVAAAISIIAAAVLVVAFFLPYAAGTEEFHEGLGGLTSLSVNPYAETLGMTNDDIADLSLFEYVRIYSSAGELGMPEEFAVVYVPLTVAPAVLGILTLLFAVLRKPVPAIVFSALTVAMTLFLNWDFADRGVIPSDMYDWGIARWLYLVAGIAVAACAIWQIVLRKRARREADES